ncbi:MAG: helix-turn-helix domain-containing protein, partial [Anaerolineae bacterium]|nr:helix-turn-helix domain-containing protein [Anaerolineae bacterium]
MGEGLGLWLRRAREARNLSVADVEGQLKIRQRYLQALEVGDYAALPGGIQARGFIRNYARFLGLPVEEALARYQAEVEGRPMQPRIPAAQQISSERIMHDRPTRFAPPPTEDEEANVGSDSLPPLIWALIGATLFFALLAGGGYLYLKIGGDGSAVEPTSTISPTQPVAMTAAPQLVNAPTFAPAADNSVTVRLEPGEHAWVRLVADGEVVFQGVADPAQPLQATASVRCQVETGNGGAFHLYINSGDYGLLGASGEVVRRAWSPTGEVSLEGP